MKKALLILAAAVLPFALGAQDSGLSEAAGSIGSMVGNVVGSAIGTVIGNAVTHGLEALAEDHQQETDEDADASEEDSVSETEDTTDNIQFVMTTGTLKKRLLSSKYRLVTDDATYVIIAEDGSEDALDVLSDLKDKTVTVTGLLNTGTNELTLYSFRAEDEY